VPPAIHSGTAQLDTGHASFSVGVDHIEGPMGVYQRMLETPVRRLALRDALTVAGAMTVREAATRMRVKGIGCAIVTDRHGKPQGMFTEAMLRQLLVHNVAGLGRPIEAFMADRFPWVDESDPVAMVLEAMQSKNYRFVCVVDDQGRASALTGQKGLIEFLAQHAPGGPANSTEPSDPLEQAMQGTPVSDIQTQPFTVVPPDMPTCEAIRTLARAEISCLLVTDAGRLIGVFGDRDALDHVTLEYERVINRPVKNVMTKEPLSIRADESVAAAVQVMAKSGYRHLPVLDRDDQLIGIVSPQRLITFLRTYFVEAH